MVHRGILTLKEHPLPPRVLIWIVSAILAVMLLSAGVVSLNTPAISGHLLLVVEGDANGLRVTHITPKQDPHNPTRGLDSEWSVAVLSFDGSELGRFPVDLSQFDLDPARVGQPLRVEGDVVWETQVATLVSIPYFANAEGLVFRRQRRVVSTVTAAVYSRLITGGNR